jgi:Uma2 family endonuclease
MSPAVHTIARVHRLSVADYHRMSETGILGPDLRTELIDGEVIEMPPIGHPHAGTVNLLADRLRDQVRGQALVAVQNPVCLDGRSEPLPDLALLRLRPDYYRNGHPGPGDVLLLIEVADTSLVYDREVKIPRYARAGIPEVWLVELGGRRLSIYRRPGANGYREICEPADLASVPLPIAGVMAVDLHALF